MLRANASRLLVYRVASDLSTEAVRLAKSFRGPGAFQRGDQLVRAALYVVQLDVVPLDVVPLDAVSLDAVQLDALQYCPRYLVSSHSLTLPMYSCHSSRLASTNRS